MEKTIQNKRQAQYLVVVLSCLALLWSMFSAYTPANAADDKDAEIVARVNGKPICKSQLLHDVGTALQKYKKYGMRKPDPGFVKKLENQALERVIDQELLYQAGQSLRIPDLEDKVTEKIAIMKRRYPSEEAFHAYIKRKGLSIEDLRKSLEKRIYIEQYLEKNALSNPVVPEADIQKYYSENQQGFKRIEQVMVSHILINVNKDASPDQEEQARKKITNLKQMIVKGGDFAELAKEYSECKSAPNGGSLGYISRGYMPAEFDNVAFTLKKGGLSDVLRTPLGYHIIKVVDKKPEGIIPFLEVKDFIGRYLTKELSRKQIASHLEELKAKAKIEIFLN